MSPSWFRPLFGARGGWPLRLRVGGRVRVALLALAVVAVLAVAALVACGGGGFDPASKVDSVRLFVVRADKPYAKPGDAITLEALFTDARKDKPRAAKLYWIPVLCVNPKDDLYYLCFAPPGDGGRDAQGTRLLPVGPLTDAGSPADAGASVDGGFAGTNPFENVPTGVDLGPFLPQGPTFSFRMPGDAIAPRQGTDPYGLVVVFNVLCAGRIEFAARDPAGSAQQVPVLCTDEDGVALPPSDYVIGVSRVYAWGNRTNDNPILEKVTLGDHDVDLAQGITLERCTTAKEKDCKENKIDVRVPDSSWEANPADVTRDGELHEQIWVDYYADIGEADEAARLLFDSRAGRISDSAMTFRAPTSAAEGTLWVVVHDNRGGASWTTVPLHVP